MQVRPKNTILAGWIGQPLFKTHHKTQTKKMKSVLITTAHRGVWYAEVEETKDLTTETLTDLKNCRMAIYWGTTRGLHELCETGPSKSSRISVKADIPVLHKVTAVFSITDKAAESWNK